jgi:hypothetical protein
VTEFTRIAWASAAARAVWEPRVTAISNAWLDVEVAAVRAGFRSAALVFGEARATASGLPTTRVAPDRFAVGPAAADLAAAYAARDDQEVGRLLGFPPCCIDFFDRVWNGDGKRDTTLAMEGPGVYAPTGANILGRWLGVRLVSHLPCGFGCEASQVFADRFAPLWPTRELAWAREILSWPVEYSALHGVAIITFPVLKVVTSTDYTATTQIVRREGTCYPAEAPTGLVFPFRRTRAAAAVPLSLIRPNATEWTDNGFSSRAAMDAAHQMVLDAIGTPAPKTVIDLGCGNGALLARIPAAVKVGLEVDASRIGRGRGDLRLGRIQDAAALAREHFDMALMANRRFEEMAPSELRTFRGWLESHVDQLLRYSYDDPRYARVEQVRDAALLET